MDVRAGQYCEYAQYMCNYFASNDCCGEMMVPLMKKKNI